MPPRAGDRIGSYEVLGQLGAGGMGQVYRARDLTLNREVAMKVLPDAVAADPDRLARFEREAKTLAALNHPGIAQVYGFESRALVMELVAGDDLSTVIARGPMTVSEARRVARQIADALDAAHSRGIIHRDLKPANIKLTPSGVVKVLDFGLAKALAPADGAATSAENSPTLTNRATELGMILGTAAYMAPEQARGKVVDQRADVWAFGVVLFEMLTGERPFPGTDITEVLASVLKTDPDWSRLPADVPLSMRRLLRRCLEKDSAKRLSAIADARLELDEPDQPDEHDERARTSGATVTATPPASRRSWLAVLGVAATAVVLTALAMTALRTAPAVGAAGPTRLSIVPPPGEEFFPDSTGAVVSPDGTMIAFVTGNAVDRQSNQLWVRRLDGLGATHLDSADGVALPFWKPDSTRIGFFSGTKLKTVAATGGRADEVADAPFGRGATWNASDVIVFAGDAGGTLSRVSANGGEVTHITTPDARTQAGHRFPMFLPDGDHFLYTALPAHDGMFDVFAGSLSDPKLATLVGAMGSAPVYADPGWLLFGRKGVLVAQPFDPRTLKTTGDPVPLADEPSVLLDPQNNYTAARLTSVSSTGALVYYSGVSAKNKTVWLDAIGRVTGTLALKPESYSTVRISPDGTQAVFVRSVSPTDSSLWLIDVARASSSLFSSGGGRNEAPVWSPDGTRVLFSSDRGGSQDFFVKSVGDASEQPFFHSDVLFKTPTDWSPDGQSVIFHQVLPKTAYDVYALPAAGHSPPVLVAGGRVREVGGRVSPNGKWVAFLSEDTGSLELYVQSFPQAGRRMQVSSTTASRPWWTRDGRALVYMTSDMHELWRVDLDPAGAGLRIGAPVRLGTLPPGVVALDAMPDRQRFLALVPDQVGVPSLTVVERWQTGLKR
jgi:Tol biopolymer transport system component/predicted Ser/Thr protein kinase